jgi:tetratricopeptide (TPR) repeat protein
MKKFSLSKEKRLLLGCGVFLGCLAASAWSFHVQQQDIQVSPAPETAESVLVEVQLFSQRCGEPAIQRLCQQLKGTPRRAELWAALGDTLGQKQRELQDVASLRLTEKVYQQALLHTPGLLPALNGLAWVHGVRHDFVQSVRYAQQVLKEDPENPAAHGLIGDAALEFGDLERAAESYQAMLDARPDLSSYSRAAYLLWKRGEVESARSLMQQAIRCGSPHAENTAWCQKQLAQMDQAATSAGGSIQR